MKESTLIPTGLWTFPEVVDLPLEIKGVYTLCWMRIDVCGCVHLVPSAEVGIASMSSPAIVKSLEILVDTGLLMFDFNTCEGYATRTHSFHRWNSPSLVKNAAIGVSKIRSPMIKRKILRQFKNIGINLNLNQTKLKHELEPSPNTPLKKASGITSPNSLFGGGDLDEEVNRFLTSLQVDLPASHLDIINSVPSELRIQFIPCVLSLFDDPKIKNVRSVLRKRIELSNFDDSGWLHKRTEQIRKSKQVRISVASAEKRVLDDVTPEIKKIARQRSATGALKAHKVNKGKQS